MLAALAPFWDAKKEGCYIPSLVDRGKCHCYNSKLQESATKKLATSDSGYINAELLPEARDIWKALFKETLNERYFLLYLTVLSGEGATEPGSTPAHLAPGSITDRSRPAKATC